jgi:guanylate kinase
MNSGQPSSTAPHLEHREAFKAILQNYQMSSRARQALQQVKLVLLLGACASGRNTVIDYLTKTGDYHFIVSDTTRPPRANNGVMEQSGREYWFRSEEEVLEDLRNGEFLEAELIHDQQVSGISIRELEKADTDNKIAINEVDLGGFDEVLQSKPDTVGIILLPPSFAEWQRRLSSRGKMAPAELKNRTETAARIFTKAVEDERVAIVVNDTILQAAHQVDHIAREGVDKTDRQRKGRALAAELLAETQDLLQSLAD